jgi:hypothetical protein
LQLCARSLPGFCFGNYRVALFVELHFYNTVVLEGDEVESDYVFLCGVMWCGYGQEEAGRELLRATLSRDPDISTLAWAMFAKGKTALRRNRKTTTDS